MNRPATFKPLRIGPIELPMPAVLAALAGYSDLPFRRLCRRFGAAYCSTEVTLDTSINLSPKLRRKLIQMHEADHPLAGQIMGCKPDTLATAARHLEAMGCDVIDLNFACPVRKVLRRKRGGHLMREPQLAVEMIRAVRAAVDLPVTLKLRSAFDAADAECECFWRIAEGGFDAGVTAVCVHPRTVEQRYSGPADWEFLAAVKRRFHDRTIIGSGDLWHAADGLRMLEQTGVDGVSFARGALGNPWIFEEFACLAEGRPFEKPTVAEQRDVLLEHFRMSVEIYGRVTGPRMMHRFGIKYASLHPTPKQVRLAFIDSRSGQRFLDVVEQFYPAGDSRPA